MLLFTDGNRTDVGDVDWSGLPPIYPVVPPSRGVERDVGIAQVSTSQTNFESAPVVIRADVAAIGFDGETIVAAVNEEQGKELELQVAKATGDGKPIGFRFQFRPQHKGVNFYRVQAFPATEEPKDKRAGAGADAAASDAAATSEQTLANNSRLVVVDQGTGPYRVLYVGGRPNWEFKFLRRAYRRGRASSARRLAADRPAPGRSSTSATPAPRANSRSSRGSTTPTRIRPSGRPAGRKVRLGTLDEVELRDSFPKAIDEMYRYHAVILDVLEARLLHPGPGSRLLRNLRELVLAVNS